MDYFDLVVIGAGPGGYVPALRAAQLGKRVAVIEKNQIGGTCLNVGCIPSKTFLKHSEWALTFKEANRNGLVNDLLAIDMRKLVSRKNQVVNALRGGIRQSFKKHQVTYYQGAAKLSKNGDIKVNASQIHGEKILLATGGRPFIPPIKGLAETDYLTTDTFFDLEELPKELAIIGGGVIAIELAFAMAPLGVAVTVIEVAEDVLLTEDEDARALIKEKLKSMDVSIFTQAKFKEICSKEVKLVDQTIPFDQLLVATGRSPNMELAEAIELERESAGKFVAVNENYQTSQPAIYAVGDLIGKMQLAHAASEEGLAAVMHMFENRTIKVDEDRIPRCLYTFPEVASIGLSAEKAQKLGKEIIMKTIPFAVNGKAISALETDGFVKLIADKKYGELLGGVIVGAHATEMIHTLAAIMESEGTIEELSSLIFAHPTLSETLGDTAKSILFNLRRNF